jgi:HD superfamily phosphohydrolase
MSKAITITCPVYGIITVPAELRPIVDSFEFQRLRRIRMGLTHLVYPSSTGTRFAHSLGVMHLARLAFNVLLPETTPNTDRTLLFVLAAALCHDVGHVATSHFLDNLQQRLVQGATDHEHRSTLVVRKLCTPERGLVDFTELEIDAICAMIEGRTVLSEELLQLAPRWAYQIVHNSETKTPDVDRLDYLARDGLGCTLPTLSPMFVLTHYVVDSITGCLSHHAKADEAVSTVSRHRLHMHAVAYRHPYILKVERVLERAIRRSLNLDVLFTDPTDMAWLCVTDTWLDVMLRAAAPHEMHLIDTHIV